MVAFVMHCPSFDSPGVVHMKVLVPALGGLLLVCQATPAAAGIYADDLTRCLVSATSTEDRQGFVRWMFAAMAVHPNVAGMSNVTDEQRNDAQRETAAMLQRLVLTDCRSEATNAMRYEGEIVLQQSFEMVGRVAMQDMMSNPAVSAEFDRLGEFLDEDRWIAFAEEVKNTPASPAPVPASRP
jgi:hypothetical protein